MKSKLCVLLVTCVLAAACAAPAWSREKVSIAMVLWRGTTDSEKGFQIRLKEFPQYDFTFTVFDPNQYKNELTRIVNSLEPRKYTAIYAFGTTVVQELKKKFKDTPIIFTAVSRPVEAGLVKSWEHSDNNVTGVSNAVPMKSLITTLSQILKVKRLGLLYNPKEPNAVIQQGEHQRLQKELQYEAVPVPIESRERVEEAIDKLFAAKVDAVILPSDSMISNNAGIIIPMLNRHKIPSIASIPEMANEHDALLGLGPDYFELGKMCANKVIAILGGEKPSNIPIGRLERLHIVVNLKTAKAIGVNVPVQVLRIAQVIRQ
jgi:putative ABC transport system substrate-binding protein